MTERIPEDELLNYEIFRECVSVPILKALALPPEKPKKTAKKRKEARGHGKKKSKDGHVAIQKNANGESGDKTATGVKEIEDLEGADLGGGNDAEDLGDFVEYLSTDLFTFLPPPLRHMTPSTFESTPSLQNAYTQPLSSSNITSLISTLSPTAISTLESYALLPSPPTPLELSQFFLPIFSSYLSSTTVAPPVPIWSATRKEACELCQREWIPLTYHHLIPRSMHAKVLKRGWHEERELGSVAWLCRACHSFVHRVCTNEELAKTWYTVELLEERDDVKKWVGWVGRVRWKAR